MAMWHLRVCCHSRLVGNRLVRLLLVVLSKGLLLVLLWRPGGCL